MTPLVATPCGGTLCVNYVSSVVAINPKPQFFFPVSSLITQARNDCVEKFMSGPWSHLFFIDSDIGFSQDAFWRVLYSGYDVAAAPYPFRMDTDVQGGFVVDVAELGPIGGNGFATIENAPTGFMCISRHVFDHMSAAGVAKDEFFDTMRIDGKYLAEDHAFCRRWRDLGGDIHLDTRAALTHQGTKLYKRDFRTVLHGG